MAQVGLRRIVPVPAEVLDGLGDIVGDGPDVGGFSGPAHGHIGQLPPAAVGEEMGPADRRALRAVNRCRSTRSRAARRWYFFAGQADGPAVVGAKHEGAGCGVDGFDGGPLRGDQAAVRSGGEGDDPVAGPVGEAAGADHLGA